MSQEKPEDLGVGTFGAAHSDPLRLLEESMQVGRFVVKLLTEMSFLRSEYALLKAEGGLLRITLMAKGEILKGSELQRYWFNPIERWLCERFSVFGAHNEEQLSRPVAKNFVFYAALKIENQLFLFLVKKEKDIEGAESLTLSAPTLIPLSTALNKLEMPYRLNQVFTRLLSQPSGLLIAAAPNRTDLPRAVAAALSLSAGHYIEWESFGDDVKGLENLSNRGFVVVSVLAADAFEAALKLRQSGFNLSSPVFAGVFCQGFVKKVCDNCARKVGPDIKLARLLPEGLRETALFNYWAGRGCDSCGWTGYSSLLPLQSILIADEQARELFSTISNPVELVENLYKKGTKPLLEVGMQKVSQGRLTLEALYELTNSVPEAYLKFYGSHDAAKSLAKTDSEPALSPAENVQAVPPEKREADTGSVMSQEGTGLAGTDATNPVEEEGEVSPLIMVAEDNADQRTILEMVFKSAHYRVICATDGLDALQKLRSGIRPALLVVDMMMPRMNGREFVSKIKADGNFREIPVLILTVVSDAEKEYDMLELGVDDYCEKTIQRKILLKRVENLIKRRKE